MSLDVFHDRFVTQHTGTFSQYLERYEQAAAAHFKAGRKKSDHFCESLMDRVSAFENLRAAADHVRRYGGSAPGIDGRRPGDIPEWAIWSEIREVGESLRSGQYQRGDLLPRRVPKNDGSSEKRTIWLMKVVDRFVTRGATQILTPLIKPLIDPLSFCCSRRGRQLALAFAQRYLVEQGRTLWIVEDARKAFDRVPRERLRQILRKHVHNDEFCLLLLHLVAPPTTKKGILQGSAASMALLDVYFTHLLHRPWRREELPPLLRYVDDCLIAMQPGEDVALVYERLQHHFRNAGMEPKHGFDKAVVDLRYETAVWLGYRLRCPDGQLEIRPKLFDNADPGQRQQTHNYIFTKFAELHEEKDSWRLQNQVLSGLLAHLAPTWPFVDPEQIYESIAAAARDAGFEDLWRAEEALERWHADHERWLWICEHLDDLGYDTTGKKADQSTASDEVVASYDPTVAPWE